MKHMTPASTTKWQSHSDAQLALGLQTAHEIATSGRLYATQACIMMQEIATEIRRRRSTAIARAEKLEELLKLHGIPLDEPAT